LQAGRRWARRPDALGTHDHNSMVRFLELRFSVHEPQISTQR
jgi:hypothetical protein